MEVQDVKQIVRIQAHIRRLAAVKLLQQHRDKREKRTFLIGQLFATERNYLTHLQLVIEHFLAPLEAALHSEAPVLAAEEVASLFSCIREIVALAVRLDARIAGLKTVENGKCKMSTLFESELLHAMFDPYKRYCSNYNIVHGLVRDLKRDNARFAAFLKQAEQRGGREDLESNLIRVVQRVPQYVISFEDILKCTPVVDPDYCDFAEAIEAMKSLGKSIDEFVGQMEQMRCWKKMESLFGDSLAGFREIELIAKRQQLWNCEVYESIEKKFRVKESKREIFVFSDLIILTKAPQESNQQATPVYEIEKINFFLTSVFTENLLLVDNADERTVTISALEPIGGNPNRIWKLKFAHLETLQKFVDVFNKASRQILKNSNAKSGGSTPLSPGSTSSEKSNDKSNDSPSSRDRKHFKKKERKLSNALPKSRFLTSEWENRSRSSEEPASGSEDLHHSAPPPSHLLQHGIGGDKKGKARDEKRPPRNHRSSSFGEAPLHHSNPQLAQSLLPCAMRSHLMPLPSAPSNAPRRPSTGAPLHGLAGLAGSGGSHASPGGAADGEAREAQEKAGALVSQDGPLRGVESEPIFARQHVKCDVFTIHLPDAKKSIVKEANKTLEETLAKICLARGWALESLVVKDAEGNALDVRLTMDKISVPACYITLKST